MREQIKALTRPQSKIFCVRLWFELTIAGRSIWSDSTLDPSTQLNALKWLNEFQHRAWGAHARDDPEALIWLLDRIISHCDEAPVIKPHVRIALDRAIATAAIEQPDTQPGWPAN